MTVDYNREFYRKFAWEIVPASPGWKVGLLIMEDVTSVEWTEIIAWKIGIDKDDPSKHVVDPITANGSEECSNEQVLRHPDGTIEQVSVQRWTNWLEAMEYFKNREK